MNLTIFNSNILATKNMDGYPTLKHYDRINVFLEFCPSAEEVDIISNLVDFNSDKIRITLNGEVSSFEGFVFLGKMKNLKSLLLEVRGGEVDFSILKNFDNLKKLKITIIGRVKEVPLSEFTGYISNLDTLVVANKLSDFKFLNGLHDLRSLFIAYNTVDLNKLMYLDRLTRMTLSKCKIRKWKPDVFFATLKYFGLFAMYKLSDLSFLSRVPNLEFLALDSMNANFHLPDFSENKVLKKILIDGKKIPNYSNIASSLTLEEIVFLNNKCLPDDFILSMGKMQKLKKVYVENLCNNDFSTIKDILQQEYRSDAYMREISRFDI